MRLGGILISPWELIGLRENSGYKKREVTRIKPKFLAQATKWMVIPFTKTVNTREGTSSGLKIINLRCQTCGDVHGELDI